MCVCCIALCHDINTFDLHNDISSSHCSRLPGSTCTLECDPGYNAVQGTIDKFECNRMGKWAATASGEEITEDNALQCVLQTCAVTSLNFEIRFFDCNFDAANTVYTVFNEC